jgi:phage-related protein
MLTGSNASVFAANVKTVGDAAAKTGGTVTGWDQVQKTFNQKVAEAKGYVEALGIKIGTALIPVVEHAVTVIMSIVTWLGKHKDIAIALASVIGGALTVAIGAYFVKLATGLADSVVSFYNFMVSSGKALVQAGQAVAEYAVKVAEMAAEAATAFVEMAADAITWAGEMMVAGAEALLPFWPIIAAVAALSAAAYLLYKYWDQIWGFIKGIVLDAFHWIRDHIKLIIAIALGPLGLAIDALWTHWNAVWGFIKGVAEDVWNFLYIDVFKPIIDIGIAYVRINIEIFKAVWSTAWAVVRDTALAVWHFLDANVVGPIKAGLGYVRDAVHLLNDAWAAAWHAVSDVALGVWHFLDANVFQPLINAGLYVIRTAAHDLSVAWDTVWNGIKSTVQSVWNFIRPIFDAIKSAAGGVSDSIGAVSHAAGNVAHAAGNVKSFFGFADGGPVPGPKGAPMLAVVHGGEYVLSNDMLSGNVPAGSAVSGAGTSGTSGAPVNVYVNGLFSHLQDVLDAIQAGQLQGGGRYSTSYPVYRR